jgi:hypothetical protein
MQGEVTGIEELSYQTSAAVRMNRFVDLSGDQTVAEAGAGALVLGVAKGSTSTSNFQGVNEVTAGKQIAVQVHGVAMVVAGAAVTRGVEVMSDSTGRAIAWVGASTNRAVGRALRAAAAAGDLIPIQLTPGAQRTT